MENASSHPQANGRISVGIGSWTDKEYKGVLFPKGLPDNQRLTTYATWFDHVELNSSYHRLPSLAFVENWVKQTPEGFIFDFKLPKEMSFDPEGTARAGSLVSMLMRVAQPLIAAGKLGTFFLVLPPSFGPKKRRLEELDGLVEKLKPHLFAVELRHSGWVADEQRERTLEFYRSRNLVWIAVDMPRIEGSTIMPPIDEVTNSRLAYLRLHGRRQDWQTLKDNDEKHTYEYSAEELQEIVTRVKTLAKNAEAVHVVANNHAQDLAPKTALALQRLLGTAKRGPLEASAG